MENNKKIIEINGVKLEVDLTNAKVISNYKIGDTVKALIKEYKIFECYPAVIIGFDNFKNRPSINIAYLKVGYKEASVIFKSITADSDDIEICPCTTLNEFSFRKENVVEMLEREIALQEETLKNLKNKKQFFLDNFNKHFEEEI